MTSMRLSALGDSLTEGLGDPVAGGWRGWAALLAAGLTPDPDGVAFTNHATSGAQTADVLLRQLPQARQRRPHVAAVIVGGNDTLRATYDIHAVARHLDTTLGSLVEDGTVLLTACLPDPGRMLGLPEALARPLGRRMRSVNTVVHALSERYDAVHVHAAEEPWLYEPAMWSVDRLHPSERGHRALARAFHRELSARGIALGEAPDDRTDGVAPTRSAQVWWMATKGTRWVLDRCTDLLPDLLRLAAAERRENRAEQLDREAAEQTAAALRALPSSALLPQSCPEAAARSGWNVVRPAPVSPA
ncbi:SGNH/GDSL hydrolase family protein [Streptacidiphilus jiangxiensis]|uniref:Lysophospholipase L1 n=1 Tax=Streptacidiphilus jiangxiensis TaxID=235985 RepID=A0A1H7UCX5_STRJI|nr:SGNH/GDSL hydrolase family protein [Streptacidiphilus jiangxiensis]SEL94518.1 Lysophospholipase L1 [Streptacidiphilus jiangxiensis]